MLFLDKTLPRAKKVAAFSHTARMHLNATRKREEIVYQLFMSKEEAKAYAGEIYWKMLTEPY